ncbi:MAG: Ig-like domain-containing protein [Gemmatimonadaceae bacterium]|nr:Ig-like domain-containing protein [Gemmatimonadaceae bacterium]
MILAPRTRLVFPRDPARLSARLAVRAAALVLLGVGAACGKDSTPPLVATTLTASVSSISFDAVGATASFAVTVRDQNGTAMPSAAPTVTSSAPSVASVSGGATPTVTAVANGSATITITAGNASAGVPVTVAQVPMAPSKDAGDAQTATAGTALGGAIRVKLRDRLGSAVAGVAVLFSPALGGGSMNPATASTGSDGTASTIWTLGPGAGIHAMQAVAAGAKDTVYFTATAIAGPAAVLVASVGNNQTAGAGTAVAIAPAVRVNDALGNPVAGIVVTFAVSSGGGTATGTTATSNASGLAAVGGWVMGSLTGANTLTASAPGLPSVVFSATSSSAPVVASVQPQPLVPGASFVLTGTGFAPTVAGNTIRVSGVTATITAASTTQLTATAPCVPSGTVPVEVTSAGAVGSPVTATLTGFARALAVGEAFVATSNTASRCNELPATGGAARYLVSVYSASTSLNSQVDFELSGNPSANAAAARQFAPLLASRAEPVAVSSADAQRDRAHWEHLERERIVVEELRARATATPRRARAAIAAAAAPTVGDRRVLYWPWGTCTDTTARITAIARYSGSRAVIWEDTANTLLAATDTTLANRYQRMGQVFDADQYDVVRQTFGDPLLRDAQTDADGRVHMIFTQRVNAVGGIVAFVTSRDQFPRSTCATSNFGEFFYGGVPTSAGTSLESTANPSGWYNFIGRTVIHEVKHIASMAARVASGAPFELSWLEEGTARHAEEVWARQALHHTAFGGNAGYGTAASNGLYCDFNPSNATCLTNDPLRRPSYGARRSFNEIRPRLLEPWNWSPYGDASGQVGSVFYQTSWSLVRYAVDRYGASDAAFLTALTSSNLTGTTNLATVAGIPMDQLIGRWTLALFTDDYPGLTNPSSDLQFRTWNLRSIYASLNADPAWVGRFNTVFPIQPTALSFGAFAALQTGVRGGANAYFELSGTSSAAQVLNLRSSSGGTASSLLRIAIARIQ